MVDKKADLVKRVAEEQAKVAAVDAETRGAEEAKGSREDHHARTATLRLTFHPGTQDDQEFDLERATRALVVFGAVTVDGLAPASIEEARRVQRPKR